MMDRDDVIAKLSRMEASLERLEHSLIGNGQPGFIEKTNERLGDLENTASKARGALGVMSLIITTIGGAFINHLWKGKV
jgi:hypothetical protein